MPPANEQSGGETESGKSGNISSLAACVPPLVAEAIAREPLREVEANESAFSGVVLFTDIAGFTGLTEKMDAEGPRGVEELSRLLNDYFSGLIEIIADHGGAVMKFAGDALIAIWRCSGGGESVDAGPARSAAQAALRIQSRTTRFAGRRPLTMKAALGAGEVLHFVLGAEDRWSSLVAGTAMEEARQAMLQAGAGQVILGPLAAAELGAEASSESAANGFRRLHSLASVPTRRAQILCLEEEARAALLRHVPPALGGRLAVASPAWLAEFRRVSVVFLNVPDLRMNRGTLTELLGVVEVIHRTLSRHGGAIENLAEDHDGLTLVAAFGLPNITYENDAVRAVRSALSARAELRHFGLDCSIGVTTGRLFCGLIGNDHRCTYSLVGDTMNRCARLMRLAEDDVYCDESTHAACQREIGFEFLRTAPLRGREAEVRLYRPLAESLENRVPVLRQAVGIVGRIAERERIRERIFELAEGRGGGVVIIEGEAGIGKTTLAMEAQEVASALGLRVLTGRGDAIEQTGAYLPLRKFFSMLLEIPEDDPEEDREEALLAWFARNEEPATLAPLLNPVVGLQFAENAVTSRMSGRPRADAISALLVRIMARAVQTGPLVVILEDCHWFDSASWTVAAELQRNVPNVLLLLLTRPLASPEPPEWPVLVSGAGDGNRIRLGGLDRDDTLAVACRALRVQALPPELAEVIHEKADGHPFFAGELVLGMRDAGKLIVEDGVCHLAAGMGDLRSESFPSSVGGVIRERLDRLSMPEQLAIKVASVAGMTFEHQLLCAIEPDADGLSAALERVVERGLILQQGPEAQGRYVFKHAIIQDVAYHQLVFSQRQALHRAVAEWNESNDSTNYPLLAHHWKHGQSAEKAIRYLDLAATEALARFANRETVAFIEDAIALSQDSRGEPDRLTSGRWRRQLGEAHFHLGRVELSRSVLRRATEILGHAMPSERLVILEMPKAVLRQVWLRAGSLLSRRDGDSSGEEILEAIRSYNLLGEIAFFTNNLMESLFCTVRGLNLAELLGPSASLAEMYAAMAIIAAAMPVPGLFQGYRALAESTLEVVGDPVSHAYVRELIGICLNGYGIWDEAERALVAAAETFHSFGHGRRREECLLNIAYGHLYRGDFTRATAVLDVMQDSASRRHDDQTMGWARLFRAEVRLSTEGPQAALEALAGNDRPDRIDALTRAGSEALAAVAMFQSGQAGRSLDRANLALSLLTEGPPVANTMMLYTAHIAETLLGLYAGGNDSERVRFQKLARRACGAATKFGRVFPIGQPRALVLHGALNYVEGRIGTAQYYWRQGRERALCFGMEYEVAYAQAHLLVIENSPDSDRSKVNKKANKLHFSLAHLGASL